MTLHKEESKALQEQALAHVFESYALNDVKFDDSFPDCPTAKSAVIEPVKTLGDISSASKIPKQTQSNLSTQKATTSPPRSKQGWISHVLIAVMLLVMMGLGFRGFSGSRIHPSHPSLPGAVTPVSYQLKETSASKQLLTKDIEDIILGDRVLGKNPEVTDFDREQFGPEPTHETYLAYAMVLPKEDESLTIVTLLRPRDWLDSVFEYDAVRLYEYESESGEVGEALFVWLELPEMGAVGWAELLGVTDEFEITQGTGNIVTGTFAHFADETIDLMIEDVDPIGCTANHPFWSVDRQEYVDAGQLLEGERILLYNGETKRIVQKLARPGPELVYNIEVFGEHVYHVTVDGVLVHNTCTNHGNSKNSTRPATLYKMVDKDTGNLLKWGISQNWQRRYSQKYLASINAKLIPVRSGTRTEMLKLERRMTELFPGPRNYEPWAGRLRNFFK